MANEKISEMTPAGALTGAEYVPLVQGGANVKATVTAIATFSKTGVVTSVNSITPTAGNVIIGYADVGADVAGAAATAQANAEAYADSLVVGMWDDRGNYDASVNAYPSTGGSGTAGAIKKGDIWTVSVAGTLPVGQAVEPGDTVRALIDAPGNTQANWAIQQNNIGYVPANSTTTISAGSGLSGGGDLSANRTISMPNVGTPATYGSATQIPVFTTDAQGRVSGVTNTSVSTLVNPQVIVYVDTDFAPTRATTEAAGTDAIFIPGVIKLGTSMQYETYANGSKYGANFPNLLGAVRNDNAGISTGSLMGLSTSTSSSGFTQVLNVLDGTVTWYAGFGLACLDVTATSELTLTTNDYYHTGMFSATVTGNLPINNTGLKAICFSGCMNNGNWFACCQTSNVNSSSVDTGVPCVQDVFHLFEIKATNTSCLFYIDGSLVATISTNIPQDDGNALNASLQCYPTGNDGFLMDNWRVVKVPSFTRTWTTH